MKRVVWVAVSLAAAMACAVHAALVGVEADEPRAFGYRLGDLVQRHVVLHVPAGLTLDEASLPPVGRHGKALELRSFDRKTVREAGSTRHDWTLAYQVFVSPPAVRTLEMPSLQLRFRGTPRDEDLRIEAWPLTVSPLVPVEVSPRRGLGDMQPDAPPPLIDTVAAQRRLFAYVALLALLLGSLFGVYFVLPWWGRYSRPFERAWRALRAAPPARSAEQWRSALQRVHAALNQTAGQVLFAGGIDRFVTAQPQFAPLRDDLAQFFAQSQQAFFASADDASASAGSSGSQVADPAALGPWLAALCRRCRDAERGLV